MRLMISSPDRKKKPWHPIAPDDYSITAIRPIFLVRRKKMTSENFLTTNNPFHPSVVANKITTPLFQE